MIEPLKHRLLVQRDETVKNIGEFIVPELAQKKEHKGVILALGKDADTVLQVGQHVLFGVHDGVDVDPKYCDNLERCIMIPDTQIRGIFDA